MNPALRETGKVFRTMGDLIEGKEKLLKTAIDLFAAKGFRGTSIRDIAQAMGMSISNIYHYFGSKEGLLLAILEESSQRLVYRLKEITQKDMEPLERFELLLETHIRISEARMNEAKIFSLDEEHLSPEGNKVNRQIQREILNIYLGELKTLKKSGHIHSRNLTVLAFNIFGTINWLLRWYRTDGALTLEQICREIISFILYGVIGNKGNKSS
ncbi:MAG: TetR/AcrR family transcriptional regulator [Deltaproteobacteria bacterium]|nr:TetR/AcrR family transcriptional regulator [Deltaproteobacteria bacterium]